LFIKNATKISISASQRMSIKNCMNYGYNKNVGLFKFQSGYRKLYLNSLKGYSPKILNAQTGVVCVSVRGYEAAAASSPQQQGQDQGLDQTTG